jgi:outer membrane protein OmpA-like peptidoglycan-associated protein
MATGTLKTWLSLAAGVCVIGAVTLSADEPLGPDSEQTKALASLTAPAAPGSFAVAAHAGADIPTPDAACVHETDTQLQPLVVSFAPGSAALNAASQPTLRHIAKLITACPEGHVQIAGHASGSGDDATNLTLSWDRADATLTALVTLGVDPAYLEAIGYGARQPIAQGDDDDTAANRRVAFRVLRKRD